MKLPDKEIVIIGGGVLGCAAAYHLAKAGKTDILLLDKNEIGGGTTRQAAALIGQVRNSVDYTRLMMRTILMLRQLVEMGYDVGWHPVGSLRLSLTEAREAEFHELVEISHAAGLQADLIDLAELRARFPELRFPGVRNAIWCGEDGYVEPRKLTRTYADAAEKLGVQICTGVTVQEILTKNGRAAGVKTDAGTINSHWVINAAGTFTGVLSPTVPAVPVRHILLVTTPLPHSTTHLPVVRLPDLSGYIRPEGADQLLVGKFEQQPMSYDPRQLPADFADPAIPSTWDSMTAFAQELSTFFPALADTQIARMQKGLPTCTPDGEFLVGQVMEGLIAVSGCNVHGISSSAGLAEIVTGIVTEQPLSAHGAMTAPTRFQSIDWEQARRGAETTYAGYYAIRK